MFLAHIPRAAMRHVLVRLLLVWLMFSILAGAMLSAWGQTSGGGIVWKICEPPPMCFISKEAKEAWAKEHQCRFIEDVCEKTTPEQDNNGLKSENQGIFGMLWDRLKDSGLRYGAEFITGLYAGLKEQVADLVHLFTNTADVIEGLIQLGKAFFDNPKETLSTIGELLGQEAVNALTKATQCGAYDLGKVVATYVNPYFAVKLAQRLTAYGGKLADASKAIKREYGCVSFAAGTLVLTSNGLIPVEQITVGQHVLSRDERSYVDRAQAVTDTMTRQASGYQLLTTENGSYQVTGEHPLWLQGKGWTLAEQVQAGDVLAGERIDSLVMANETITQPLRVYNFSVGRTPSYFVGSTGIWVHNAAKCSPDIYSKPWSKLTSQEKGFRGEVIVVEDLIEHGYEPVPGSFDYRGKPPTEAYAARAGAHTLDGVLKASESKYVLIETKSTGGTSKSDPEGCVAKLCKIGQDDRQMSEKYILERLTATVSDPVERQKIIDGLRKNDGSVVRVYAQVDESGPIYSTITEIAGQGVKIGEKWKP